MYTHKQLILFCLRFAQSNTDTEFWTTFTGDDDMTDDEMIEFDEWFAQMMDEIADRGLDGLDLRQ